MTKAHDFLPSLEEVAYRVDLLEDAIGSGGTPFDQEGVVMELQDHAQQHVAEAAAKLMTGVNWRRERRDYLATYGLYRRVLGSVAVDIAGRVYDGGGDSGEVKRVVFGYVEDSKKQMVTLDYEKRLEASAFERSKQWLAHHRKTRAVLPLALSAATTTALFRAGEASSSLFEITPAQGGMMGVMTLIGSMAIKSAFRNGPRQVGTALKDQFNAHIKTYSLDESTQRQDRYESLGLDALPEKYAERHLTLPFGAAAIYLVNYDVESRGDIQPMIEGLLDITEASLNESYGIDPEKVLRESWLQRLSRRMAPVEV